MTPEVLVILINYNGLRDTLECLSSLRSVKDATISTLVLDNGSSDCSEISQIHEMFPEVYCERSEKNLGFAAGCNYLIKVGLRKFSADYVLLLNNERCSPFVF
jgi:GT2 family glycosyltransferase